MVKPWASHMYSSDRTLPPSTSRQTVVRHTAFPLTHLNKLASTFVTGACSLDRWSREGPHKCVPSSVLNGKKYPSDLDLTTDKPTKSALHVHFTLLNMWLSTSAGYILHGVLETVLVHADTINRAPSDCPGKTASRKLRYD
jgi:hypothetical protein